MCGRSFCACRCARPALPRSSVRRFLIVLALPAFSMHTKLLGFSDLPKDLQIVQTYERIQEAFPGSPAPAQVVVRAPNVTAPRYVAAFREVPQVGARER